MLFPPVIVKGQTDYIIPVLCRYFFNGIAAA